MTQRRLELSEYRGVWIFAMFDLPVLSKEERRRATQFRKLLLTLGFEMMQFSVYARYFPREEAAETIRKRLRKGIPPAGQVRLMLVTDKQFGKMEIFYGKKRADAESPPDQLQLF